LSIVDVPCIGQFGGYKSLYIALGTPLVYYYGFQRRTGDHYASARKVRFQEMSVKLTLLTVVFNKTKSLQMDLCPREAHQLDVPSFRLPTVGSRAFPIAGAKVWNSLPDDVTSAPSLSIFRRHLKTYLFRCLILLVLTLTIIVVLVVALLFRSL